MTSGPSRLPQTSLLPELETAELVVELVALDPPAPELPPQTLVVGTQSSTCSPSALVSAVHVRSEEHCDDDEQLGAQ
jgi:hypothetical protein